MNILSHILEQKGKYRELYELVSRVKLAKELTGRDVSNEMNILTKLKEKIGTAPQVEKPKSTFRSSHREGKEESIISRLINLICRFVCRKYQYTCEDLPDVLYELISKYSTCFDPKPIVVSWEGLYAYHSYYFGQSVYAIMYDSQYWIPTSSALDTFIHVDWTNRKKYIYDLFDCDDFARIFKAHVLEFLNVNAIGVAIGEVRDKRTGELVGYHAWNILVYYEHESEIHIVHFEPQTDKSTVSGVFGNYVYIPYWVEY